jgi:chromate transporter
MQKISLRIIFGEFFWIGLTTLGGGYAIIPLVLSLTEKYKLMDHQDFHQLLSLAQIIPGPVGVNLPLLIGRKIRGVLGAIAALLGILLSPIIIVVILTAWLEQIKELAIVNQILIAVRVAVAAVILVAGMELFKPKIKVHEIIVFFVILFVLFFFKLNVVYVLLIGFVMGSIFSFFNRDSK